MKNKKTALFAFLLLAQLTSLNARAENTGLPVGYAEVLAGCRGEEPDFSVYPAVNLVAGSLGEVRIGGVNATRFIFDKGQLVFRAPDGREIPVGSFVSVPCTVDDAGHEAVPHWMPLNLSPQLSLDLSFDKGYVLNLTTLVNKIKYKVTWD